MTEYTFQDAYQHYLQHGDSQPLYMLIIEKIILPLVTRDRQIKMTVKEKYNIDAEKEDGLHEACLQLFTDNIEDIQKIINRWRYEGTPENMEGYLYTTIANHYRGEKFYTTHQKIEDVFNRHPEEYYFWVQPHKERCKDSGTRIEKRNYYLSQWNEIPDLFQDALKQVLTRQRFNPKYLRVEEVKLFMDEAFETTNASLKVKHFTDYFRDVGYFTDDALTLADKRIAASNDDDDSEDQSLERLTVDENSNPEDAVLKNVDEMSLYGELWNSLKEKEKEIVSIFSTVVMEVKKSKENKQIDLAKKAEQHCHKKYSKNTFRKYIKEDENSINNKLDALLSDYELDDEEKNMLKLGFFNYVYEMNGKN